MHNDVLMLRHGPYRICFVCSGNICRSPIAEAVLRTMLQRSGVDDVVVDSAGTDDWHIGERADLRTLRVLAIHGYDGRAHRARQFDGQWFTERDLVVGFDRGHIRTLRSWAPDPASRAKVRLLSSFDPSLVGIGEGPNETARLEIPDPYYAGTEAFATVLAQVEAAARGLLHVIGRRIPESRLALDRP
jgi:protein-tyrosine phosphatase